MQVIRITFLAYAVSVDWDQNVQNIIITRAEMSRETVKTW